MADKISLEFDTGSGATHLSKSESVLAAQATENYYQLLGQFKPLRELILIAPMQVPESVFDISVARKAGYFNYPPVGLLYIASVAKHADPNIQVKVIDLNLEMLENSSNDDFSYGFWKDRLLKTIQNCQSPCIGISCMFDVNKETFVQISQFIKQEFPSVPLLAGGVQATYDYEELLSECGFDMIFRKESEEQFSAFIHNINKINQSRQPKGLAFRYKGQVLTLGDPAQETPVEFDIREAYSLIPIEEYHKYGGLAVFSRYNGKEKPFATILSNRGCRAYCTFCTVRDFNGKGIRARSVESVIDELKYLWERGVRQIDWLDDDFLWDRERTLHLLKRMTEEVPDLEWISNNGLIAAVINEEIMEWMVRSGLKAFKVGIESGNDAMLKKILKPTSKRKLMMASELFKKYPEIFCSGNFILGFPDETFGEMMDSFNFARKLDWDWASFYICQPLVGTEMYSIFQDLGDSKDTNKALNPGRLAQRGEMGIKFNSNANQVLMGREVFNLPPDTVPSRDQLNEIWFTFNLLANFLDNRNYRPGGNIEKLIRWYESIFAGYPHDASMAAALSHGYRLTNQVKTAKTYQKKFEDILSHSAYWKTRVKEFPEILEMADL
jgi:radical SAM superfamily enzyme YgiQ (UPF0313 family)